MLDLITLRRTTPVLIVAAGVGTAVALGTALPAGVLAAAFVAAHAFTIPDRTERRLSLSPMVAVAALLVTDGSLAVIVPGAAVGMPIGWWLARTTRGPRSLDHIYPADPIALVLSVSAYAGFHVLLVAVVGPGTVAYAVAAGLAVVIWYLAATVARVLVSATRRRVTARLLGWQALLDGPAYLALFSGGAMFGLAWNVMSWWAFPIALLPYGFSHLSLTRVAVTRTTYRQTIKALGRIPEAGGLIGHGRAERTAELAGALAGEVRLPPPEVERVEYAGLLHDVGRVVFNDPAVADAGYTDADVAAWGAAIIQESPFLHRVAGIVADQHEPYRRPGEARNDTLPRSAQVVRVAAAYDRAVHEQGNTPVEALETLHRGAAYDYDPEVVGALRRVLRRRNVAGV